jgi:ABC-type cobalamin/Fe3+-siderophores transport system ATPase subunit
MENTTSIFEHGSVWLKADFHLHTKADKEFKYGDEKTDFIKDYIKQLKNNGVGIGIITNHNKFDLNEYKSLRQKAQKENIYLIPGVELSVNDGSNGIHCLIAFEYESWIRNVDNFIEQFLNSAFEGVPNRENENTRCNYSLSDLFKKLEEHRKARRDSFIIMAHIEQKSGFCNELDGGRIKQITSDEHFKRNVLGFQKLRTHDIKQNLVQWFGDEKKIPAFVEGSDCKKLEEVGDCGTQIGRNKECFLKIGDFNFGAVKFALIDKESRISENKLGINNAYIKSISFEGGLLDQMDLSLSHELNNLIGIRGSGKSAILESIRYALNIPLSEQAVDKNYKEDLLKYALGSGGKLTVYIVGKLTVYIVDKKQDEYRIEKIYGEEVNIYKGDERLNISIDAIFQSPIYFGQKDLSNKDINFEADLINKLIGNRLNKVKERINAKKREINNILISLKEFNNLEEEETETKGKIRDIEYKLKRYSEKGVEEKLQKQARFNSDILTLNNIRKNMEKLYKDISKIIKNHSTYIKVEKLASEDNQDIFDKANTILEKIAEEYKKLDNTKDILEALISDFDNVEKELISKKEELKEEFAQIKREIEKDDSVFDPDEFLEMKREIEDLKLKIKEIDKSETERGKNETDLMEKISELQKLWHDEFKTIEKEVKMINKVNTHLSIEIEYKGRKDKFLLKLKEIFRGTKIREKTYQQITEKYRDFIEIYKNKTHLKEIVNETHLSTFDKKFDENIEDLLTYQIENKFIIKYKGKDLARHSLGQRASALILFLLAQKENDVLIIDQPEDDLDNQTIYEEVIKEIKKLKGNMQFIFATHNANIPVLGDSEKIISCTYSEEKIEVNDGTIDHCDTQKQIVTIMEGGVEAFDRRKNIYEIWSTKR